MAVGRRGTPGIGNEGWRMQQLKNRSLEGKVALVTGASRGGGRGIALVLGEAGATVYVTGRSVQGQMTHPHLAGTTIDETAEMVTARGGIGIPVRVDHTVDAEVEALLGRIEQEQGKLDIMVNNAWGGYQNNNLRNGPFWEQEMFRWDNMYLVGVR